MPRLCQASASDGHWVVAAVRISIASCGRRLAISAVPREWVRDRVQVDALAASIGDFLTVNRITIQARRLVFDFRTPSVPEASVAALNLALEATVAHGVEEVLIIEM